MSPQKSGGYLVAATKKDERDGSTAHRYWVAMALLVYGWSSLLMMRLVVVVLVRKGGLGWRRLLISSLMGRVVLRCRGMDGHLFILDLRGRVQAIVWGRLEGAVWSRLLFDVMNERFYEFRLSLDGKGLAVCNTLLWPFALWSDFSM